MGGKPPLRFGPQAGEMKSLFMPGGALLAFAIVLAESGFSRNYSPVVEVCYYAAFVAGLLLAWRFHSSRVLSALVLVLLGRQAVDFFITQGHGLVSGPGRTALEAIAFLVPVNFLLPVRCFSTGPRSARHGLPGRRFHLWHSWPSSCWPQRRWFAAGSARARWRQVCSGPRPHGCLDSTAGAWIRSRKPISGWPPLSSWLPSWRRLTPWPIAMNSPDCLPGARSTMP